MVDDACPGIDTAPLALLALVVVQGQDVPAQVPPLGPGVELMLPACIQQSVKLHQPAA